MASPTCITIPLPSDPALITSFFTGVGLVIIAVARATILMRGALKAAKTPDTKHDAELQQRIVETIRAELARK